MTTKEKIAVMLAYEDGKPIQFYHDNKWCDWIIQEEPTWDWARLQYRIKSEPELRPYKDAEEFLQAQKEHGLYIYIRIGYYDNPVRVLNEGVAIIDFDLNKKHYNECEFIPYSMLLRDFKFVDGTPCGVMEEDV